MLDELITLGRVADNMIQIEDGSVSSRHAQLSLARQRQLPTPGPGVHQRHARERSAGERTSMLKHGDRVRFGQIEAAYYSDNMPRPPSPSRCRPRPSPSRSLPPRPIGRPISPTRRRFRRKSREKDPIGMYIMLFAAMAALAFVVALVLIFTPPTAVAAPGAVSPGRRRRF